MTAKRTGTSLKSLPLDLLTDAGGSAEGLARVPLLREGGYVFLLGRLLTHHGIRPRGVLHLGGNTGQESIPYMMLGFEKVLYVEAHPEVCAALNRNLEQLALLEQELAAYLATETVTAFASVQAAVSDRDGEGPFYVTGSTLFCSTRRPVGFTEWKEWVLARSTPAEADEFRGWTEHGLEVQAQITVPLRTLDSILERDLPAGWRPEDFNVLGMNIQGAELDALRGSERALQHIELIQTELNFVEHYEGNPSADQLRGFLERIGFREAAVLRAGPVGTGVYVRSARLTGRACELGDSSPML